MFNINANVNVQTTFIALKSLTNLLKTFPKHALNLKLLDACSPLNPNAHFNAIHVAAAYKHADGKKIDGKRVLVDVERARTVKGWLPRRLGGGLGGTRRGGSDVNIKHSGREDNERERERYRLEQRSRDDRARASRRDPAPSSTRRRSRSRSKRRSESRSHRRERRAEEENGSGSRRRRRSRSRSPRRRKDDRDKDKEREKKRSRRDKERKEPKVKPEHVKVKEEPTDDYPEFSLPPLDMQIKQEPEDENKYNPEEANGENEEYNY